MDKFSKGKKWADEKMYRRKKNIYEKNVRQKTTWRKNAGGKVVGRKYANEKMSSNIRQTKISPDNGCYRAMLTTKNKSRGKTVVLNIFICLYRCWLWDTR